MGCASTKEEPPKVNQIVPDSSNERPDQKQGGTAGGSAEAKPGANPENVKENLTFLQQVNLFKRLPPEVLPELAKVAVSKQFAAKENIIKQGEDGDEFFLIKTGEAIVTINNSEVAKLKSKDYFGENALLRSEPRTATITADTGLAALSVSRAQFNKLGLHEKLEFPKRGAVGGGADLEVAIKEPSPKTQDEMDLIIRAVKQNKNLDFLHTQENLIEGIANFAWKENVDKGKPIINQGDLDASYMYIVQEGSFEITIKAEEGGQSAANMANGKIGTIDKGESFGELAILYLAPRAATITAVEQSQVWVIARPHFKKAMEKASEANVGEYVKHLNQCDITKRLGEKEKQKVAKALDEMTFGKGDVVFKQGEPGEMFYILVEGSIEFHKDNKSLKTDTASKDKVVHFGERALESAEPRAATVTVTSDSARCLTLDKISYDILLEKRSAQANTRQFGQIKRQDLKRLGLLGCGGFGAVELVEHLKTNDTYALKQLSKGYIVKSGMQQSVISEKNVQLLCDSSFVVKLYETYNGQESLYLLLELALGGELYATYNKKGLWGKVPHAKFYVAGTVFAFEHLHSKKIIFRDLKPENLLLNEEGKVKLTDMGLAKVVVGKTFTTCGTPDYFAPELIASKGHTRAVDWWTLGILTFELLGGHPPFESATPMQIYQKVNKGIGRVAFPKPCTGQVESLIRGLCHSQPHERLPMKQGETENIKKHAWYQGFDWPAMSNCTLEPPYQPGVKSKKDMANFSARKEDMPPQLPYKDPGTGWDKGFATST